MVSSIGELCGGLANKKGKFDKTPSNDYKLNLPTEKSENVHVSPKPSVRLSDTPVSSCRTPTEIYNHNNNHDTNSRSPEIGSKSSVVGKDDAKESSHDVIADGMVVLRKTKRHNTVLVTQAPPRGASAHARYLSVSKISARQDGRTG